MNKDFYISPSLFEFKTYLAYVNNQEKLVNTSQLHSGIFHRELLSGNNKKESQEIDDEISITTFEKVLLQNRCFIIAEPGCGKSKLLREAAIKLVSDNIAHEVLFVDIKEILAFKSGYTEIALDKVVSAARTVNSDQTFIKTSKTFRTEKFSIRNSSDVIIFFDALDEVAVKDIPEALNLITNLSNSCPDARLYVSCRTHHLQRIGNYSSNAEEILQQFKYVYIDVLDESDVRRFLSNYNITSEQISKLTSSIRRNNHLSVLQIPRYLEIFADLLEQGKISADQSSIKLTELLEIFVYRKLDSERNKSDGLTHQHCDILKRVLEKLALLMKMSDVRVISHDELLTFFDSLKSNLSIAFLGQVPIAEFFDHTLLKDNITTVEFENASFHEYLAAKELDRLSKQNAQILYDLIVDAELHQIYPKWNEVYSFLTEIRSREGKHDIAEFIFQLVLLNSYPNWLRKEQILLLLTTDPDTIPRTLRKQIFEFVFKECEKYDFEIDANIIQRLAKFYNSNYSKILLSIVESTSIIELTNRRKLNNLIWLIREIFKVGQVIVSAEYWHGMMVGWLEKDTSNGLFRQCYLLAEANNDVPFIIEQYRYFKNEEGFIFKDYLSSCFHNARDIPFCVDLFLAGIEFNMQGVAQYIMYVKSNDAVFFLLNFWSNNFAHFVKFIKDGDNGFLFDDSWKAFLKKSLEGVPIVLEILERIALEFIHQEDTTWMYDSRVPIRHLFVAISNYSPTFFQKVIVLIEKHSNNSYYFYRAEILPYIVKPFDIKWLFDSYFLNDKLWDWKGIMIEARGEVLEKAMSNFPEQFKAASDESNEVKKQNLKTSLEVLKEDILKFVEKYWIEKQKYSDNSHPWKINDWIKVYRGFCEHEDWLEKGGYSSQSDIQLLLKLKDVTVDLIKYTLPFEKRSHLMDGMYYFNFVLHGASLLKVDMHSPFMQQQIVQQLSFAHHYRVPEDLLFKKVIKESWLYVNPEIKKIFIKTFTDEWGGDWTHSSVDGILKFYEKQRDDVFIPLIKLLASSVIIDRKDVQTKALDLLSDSDKIDKEFFKKIYAVTPNDNSFHGVYHRLNEILIEKFQDDDAIKDRMKIVKLFAQPFVMPNAYDGRVRSVGAYESELSHMGLAKPLLGLSNAKYIPIFKNLMVFALRQARKDPIRFADYELYVWRIVNSYLSNLKSYRTAKYLIEFDNYFMQRSDSLKKIYCKHRINLGKVEATYLEDWGKYLKLNDAINIINSAIERRYLPIISCDELWYMIEDTIQNELKNFIEEEGFYRVSSIQEVNEDLIQKTLVTQIENALLKRGLRKADIRREVQLLDNKRIDLLISYGYLQPVMVELKLTHNDDLNDLNRSTYKNKLLQYVKGTGAGRGIYLIIQTKPNPSLSEILPKVSKEYADLNGVLTIGLNAYKTAKLN